MPVLSVEEVKNTLSEISILCTYNSSILDSILQMPDCVPRVITCVLVCIIKLSDQETVMPFYEIQ